MSTWLSRYSLLLVALGLLGPVHELGQHLLAERIILEVRCGGVGTVSDRNALAEDGAAGGRSDELGLLTARRASKILISNPPST